MICQITNPTKMIETLASLIIKDGTDLSDVLVFVPTRRAGRKLEKFLSDKFDGAAIMPKIVGLGEGDDSADDTDAAGKTERKIILAKILLSVADKIGVPCSFGGALSVAGELLVLQDYLENDGIDARDIDWNNMIPDERKAAFLNLLKNVDIGPTATQVRNNGIRNWKNHLSEYRSVFCCGSTASVKPTRDLMDEIARMPNGYVILPGLVSDSNDIGRADPYWSVKKFLAGRKIETIDVGGAEKMTFFNNCFNNDLSGKTLKGPENIIQIDCDTESEEAASVAMVSAMAKASGQSVLIITPDVSGEQRIKAALSGYGLSADSSGGVPLSQTQIGRFSGLVFDYLNGDENRDVIAADLRQIVGAKNIAVLDKLKYDGNLFDFLITAANKLNYEIGDIATAEVFFDKVLELSNMAEKYGLDFSDVSSVFSEVMKSETVRAPMSDDYDVAILGTAEARMQTADVVILTGLNDGMFPSDGFRHSWLPRNIARKIGLPDSDSKVSLMALDFMTLSCGKNVYWTRSKMAGGSKTTQSRFLSRVGVRVKVNQGTEILAAVRAADEAPFAPLDSSPPVVKYSGDYHATWLESLTHNPYLFYARHILHLRKRPDIGESMGAKEFGTLVHDVLERAETGGIKTVPELILMLEEAALNYIGRENILFRFWRNRFREFAPVVSEMMKKTAVVEKTIRMKYKGRNLIAKADRIEDGARVIDYKTGNVPSNEQLGLGKAEFCAMPQLPIEAMIMRENAPDVSMAFLRLQKNHVGMIDYDCEKTARAIEAVKKTLEIAFNTTVYARPDHHLDDKYTDFDDLCRYGD